jgi:PAS domain S-box-containing protein
MGPDMPIANLSIFRIIVTILAVFAAGSLFLFSLKKQKSGNSISIMVFAVFLVVGAVAYSVQSTGVFHQTSIWTSIINLCIVGIPSSLLVLAISLSGYKRLINYKTVLLLLVGPVIFQIWFWIEISTMPVQGELLAGVGLRLLFEFVYLFILETITLLVWGRLLTRRIRINNIQLLPILFGLLFSIFILLIEMAKLTPVFLAFFFVFSDVMETLGKVMPFSSIDLLLVSFTVLGITILFTFFHNSLIDKTLVPYSLSMESLQEAWMILDHNNKVVDLNSAAQVILGFTTQDLVGQSATKVLKNWPDLIDASGKKDLGVEGSIRSKQGWQYLNAKVYSIAWQDRAQPGRLIIWQDITDQKMKEYTRQHAREEMFILLHSISDAASRAISLDDFLKTCNYQLVYSFPCYASLIFLFKEKVDQATEQDEVILTAHQGLWDNELLDYTAIAAFSKISSVLMDEKEPLLISDVSSNPLVPEALRAMDISSLLCVPMIADERVLGMACLIRQQKPIFSSDEMVRLSLVLEQIAAFVQSDRQRHLSISLAERQRLVRDLHDSVTQKLYGLVTLTEAAQAGLEAKTLESPARILSRIGENARQALKEMRLFLYQMHPIDLEKEGLVSVLHQRLAAVEGRADVKVRFLADEKISLDKEKELTLYYIAQEALNNAMKHASANSVMVSLKQKRVNTVLEITDDGVGFDPKSNSTGGMGLVNMKERAKQVGAKLKISAMPGDGTKIMVTVRHANGRTNSR